MCFVKKTYAIYSSHHSDTALNLSDELCIQNKQLFFPDIHGLKQLTYLNFIMNAVSDFCRETGRASGRRGKDSTMLKQWVSAKVEDFHNPPTSRVVTFL